MEFDGSTEVVFRCRENESEIMKMIGDLPIKAFTSEPGSRIYVDSSGCNDTSFLMSPGEDILDCSQISKVNSEKYNVSYIKCNVKLKESDPDAFRQVLHIEDSGQPLRLLITYKPLDQTDSVAQ